MMKPTRQMTVPRSAFTSIRICFKALSAAGLAETESEPGASAIRSASHDAWNAGSFARHSSPNSLPRMEQASLCHRPETLRLAQMNPCHGSP